MADAATLREFLAVLSYRVDEASQRRFVDAITSMTETVLKLSGALTAAASGVAYAVLSMAHSGEQMYYFSQRVGDTVTDIEAMIYAFSRLGLAPEQTKSSLLSLADAFRNNPYLRDVWSGLAGGPEINTQRLQQFGDVYRRMGEEQQRFYRRTFSMLPDDFWMALSRGGPGAGTGEYNATTRLFRFDPDYAAQQSALFENAWRGLNLRITSIWGGTWSSMLPAMTQVMSNATRWLDGHATNITDLLGRIRGAASDVTQSFDKLVTTIIDWASHLDSGSQTALAVLTGIVAVASAPGLALAIASLSAFILALRDFQQWQDTGKSDLGIDWKGIGEDIHQVYSDMSDLVGIVKELTAAFGGTGDAAQSGLNWAVRVFIEFMGTRFLLGALGPLGQVLIVARELHSVFENITRWFDSLFEHTTRLRRLRELGPNPSQEQIDWALKGPLDQAMPKGSTTRQQLEQLPGEFMQWWRRHAPGLPGGLPPEQMPQQPSGATGGLWDLLSHFRLPPPSSPPSGSTSKEGAQDTSGIFNKLWNLLNYLNPISAAQAEELPSNVKELTQKSTDLRESIGDLNDTLTEFLMQVLLSGHFGGVGAGGGIPPMPGGGSRMQLNDPQITRDLQFLMSQGIPMADAIAMLGGAYGESNLNPLARNPKSGAFGMFQWLGSRQTGLANFAREQGRDPTDRTTQLLYAIHELKTTESETWRRMQAAQDWEQKQWIFHSGFERGRSDENAAAYRHGHAVGATLMRDPNIAAQYHTDRSVTMNSNVTINTADDPYAIRNALTHERDRHWADVYRYGNNPYQ